MHGAKDGRCLSDSVSGQDVQGVIGDWQRQGAERGIRAAGPERGIRAAGLEQAQEQAQEQDQEREMGETAVL
ncbi:hypothetical protein PMIN04_009900, partial [Paraphaeosphaeria minitans]